MQNLHVCATALIWGMMAAACGKSTTGDEGGSGASSATANGGGANTNVGGGNSTATGTGTASGSSTGTASGSSTGTASGSSTSTASGTGSTTSTTGTGTSTTSVITSTCIVGTKGCLCDTTGKCASGLTCTTQGAQQVCCSGTDCKGTGTSIGASCAPAGAATCTPGVTIPQATGNNDNCGYVSSSFAESVILCAIQAQGGGDAPAQIQAFYNDEWPLTLGCSTSAFPVTTNSGSVASAFYPQTGDPKCVDTSDRPMRPSLFITDITSDPSCKAGDQQNGGKAYDPVAVFGIWTNATMANDSTGTPVRSSPSLTYWNLGSSADAVPAAATQSCPCTQGNCITTGHTGRGYGAEVRYEAGLISGHSYRLQVQMHDGDQTQGGDAGEACVIFCAGTGTCTPKTCADFPGSCGQQPDGCGGLTPVCAECTGCTPQACEAACPEVVPGAGVTCQTTQNSDTGYILPCNKEDKCGGLIACWCPVG